MWTPQPGSQVLLLACPVEDVFFGGTRGGGKTDGLLGDWQSFALEYGGSARGIIFRRTYPELEELEQRSHEIYGPLGWTWRAAKRMWVSHDGARLRLRQFEKDTDALKYQGHQYQYIGWDELTNWASPNGIDQMRACMRSPTGIPCLMRSTGNPGGPGHNWVKSRYIDPAPPYKVHVDPELGIRRVFIPSRMEENLALLRNDPDYWKRVVASANGREDLIKAWRYGLWDIVAGGMFDDVWKPVHLVEPFRIPRSWYVDRSFDWGSSDPFSVQWWAESDGTQLPDGRCWPRGTLFHIAEWYGWNGKPNEGLRMIDTEIAKKIREIEEGLQATLLHGNDIHPGPADIPKADNGVSIEDNMARLGIRWESPKKFPGSRVTGWMELRKRLLASMKSPMEEPGMFIFSTCRNWIRTVPVLPRDQKNPDDVDTEAEDHAADATRYRLLHERPIVTVKKLQGF